MHSELTRSGNTSFFPETSQSRQAHEIGKAMCRFAELTDGFHMIIDLHLPALPGADKTYSKSIMKQTNTEKKR